MSKFLAVLSSLLLHIILVTGFTATGTAAVHTATDRAFEASLVV